MKFPRLNENAVQFSCRAASSMYSRLREWASCALFAADMPNLQRRASRRIFLRLVAGVSALGFAFHTSFAVDDDDDTDELTTKLESIRRDHGLPALAAAAIRRGELVANSATGVRELGAKEQVTINDLWHVGSCTKSMTAGSSKCRPRSSAATCC